MNAIGNRTKPITLLLLVIMFFAGSFSTRLFAGNFEALVSARNKHDERVDSTKRQIMPLEAFAATYSSSQNAASTDPVSAIGSLNVKDFGALGNGIADDTATIRAAINALPDGGVLYFPNGRYRVSSTIDLSSKAAVTVLGDSVRSGNPGMGSVIVGNFVGTLFKYAPRGGNIFVRGMSFVNYNNHRSSKSVHIQRVVNGSIENSQIFSSGGYGLYVPGEVFAFRLASVKFNGSLSTNPNSIGFYMSGNNVTLVGCEFTGWAEGIRTTSSITMVGGRFEVNRIGILLGKTEADEAIGPGGLISGVSFEANDTAIRSDAMSGLQIGPGVSIQGSVGAPSGQSEYGVRVVGPVTASRIHALGAGGNYSKATISIEHGSVELDIDHVIAINDYSSAKTWDIRTSVLDKNTFRGSNFKLRPDDTISKQYLQRHGMFQYLAQIDYLNPSIEGKNLRGKNIAVSIGSTMHTVAFTSRHSADDAQIATVTPAQTGGKLAAGTYYYLSTIVTTHGESSGINEKIVTVSAPNNSVQLTFNVNKQDGFKRRIYRGRQPGIYDGYFETSLNSNATFRDNGGAFTGLRSSPTTGVDDTSMIEPDANYAVLVTPSWNTTYWVTGKATTGFIINFGTPAPANGGTIDYFIVR